jgi:hypothetical protein
MIDIHEIMKESNNNQTMYPELNDNLYSGLNEFSSSKIIGIISSAINIVFFTPLFYSIIWYEKYGSGIHRTLINQLVSSCCWLLIAFNLFVQIPVVVFSLIGAAPELTCTLTMMVQSVVTVQSNLLMIAISAVKYFYIFIIKSPSGVNDEFWCQLINISTTFFACLSQAVFLLWPGKFPFNYYVCTGTDPRLIKGTTKVNIFLPLSFFTNIVVYIFVFVKIKIYVSRDPIPTIQTVGSSKPLPSLLEFILKTSLADLATMAVVIVCITIIQTLFHILNYLSPEKLGTYPYNHLYHIFQHLIPAILHFLILLFNFIGHSHMRKTIWIEILDLFHIISN